MCFSFAPTGFRLAICFFMMQICTNSVTNQQFSESKAMKNGVEKVCNMLHFLLVPSIFPLLWPWKSPIFAN